MALVPHLFFDGACRAAFDFYAEVFDAKVEHMPFSSSPMKVPEGYENRIMHTYLKAASFELMGADNMPEMDAKNGDMALSFTTGDVNAGRRIFSALMEGGEVIVEFQDQFWGAVFGHGRDRFGVCWMVNVSQS